MGPERSVGRHDALSDKRPKGEEPEGRYTPGIKVSAEDGLQIFRFDRADSGDIVDLALEGGAVSRELLPKGGGIALAAPKRGQSFEDGVETEDAVDFGKI